MADATDPNAAPMHHEVKDRFPGWQVAFGADRDDVLAPPDIAHVASAASAGADDGDVQFAVEILPAQEGWRRQRAERRSGEQFGEVTAG